MLEYFNLNRDAQKEEKHFELETRPFIKGVVDRFENGNAVIETEDGQRILWPRKDLPDSIKIKEGEVVKLHLSTDAKETQDREEAVKALLNQILKNSS